MLAELQQRPGRPRHADVLLSAQRSMLLTYAEILGTFLHVSMKGGSVWVVLPRFAASEFETHYSFPPTTVYPCPLFSVRFRKPLFGETGHTIMNLLAVSDERGLLLCVCARAKGENELLRQFWPNCSRK